MLDKNHRIAILPGRDLRQNGLSANKKILKHVILSEARAKDLVSHCEARFPSTCGSGQASPAAQNDMYSELICLYLRLERIGLGALAVRQLKRLVAGGT
jgi:hypothetical protein